MSIDASGRPNLADEGPSVSIGLPVYNGANYIARAIESVLGQSFADFELIICDNASTDNTRSICLEYARHDSRVHYLRNERNLGAGPNYDLAFHHSRGEFFNWLAHDDGFAPLYLEKTVACHRQNSDAVLCYTGIAEIDSNGEVMRAYRNHLPGVDSPHPSTRFAGMTLYRHECEPFFGLFRRAALVGSGLHGTYPGSDRVLLAEMALRGRCVEVSDPLFLHREHDARYTRAVLLGDRSKAESWQDTTHSVSHTGARLMYLSVYGRYWRIVRRTIGSDWERWCCYVHLFRWWFTDRHFRSVVRNLLARLDPRLLDSAVRAKHAIFGISGPVTGGLPPADGRR